jgi:hypothetical protein
MSKIGLNSTALYTLANEMRLMNEKPDMLMPHAEYMAASGIYAMISGLESLAVGLKAEEERQAQEAREAYKREIEWMRTVHENRFGTYIID